MRFIRYLRPQARECRTDRDAPIEVTGDIRRALHPHEPEALLAGRLRRPFLFAPPTPGRRSHHAFVRHPSPDPAHHERGAIVFAYPDESVFFVEAPEGDA